MLEGVGGDAARHAVIFCGSGSTAAINRLVDVLNLRIPADLDDRWDLRSRIPVDQRPVVFIGPYEHHSNELPWRESIADVVVIREDRDGHVDLDRLREELERYADRPLRIGSFSAASNVTGIVSDTRAISRLLHEHGAQSFFDFAAAAPYVAIEMEPDDDPLAAKDAVFISPHKFIGGPGTPGVLVARRELFRNRVPSMPGGGTVAYVNQVEHAYLTDIEHREEGGTPAIVESIRAGLVFGVKAAVGVEAIRERESAFIERALRRWEANPAIEILGSHEAERLSIVSFVVRHRGRYLHHNFVVALLNDLFGIQSRGGCSCAGPYGHRLLGIDLETSHEFEREIARGCEGIKPGWVRVNFNYFISEAVFEFILDAVDLVATEGWRALPDYDFDALERAVAASRRDPRAPALPARHPVRGWRGRLAAAPPPRARDTAARLSRRGPRDPGAAPTGTRRPDDPRRLGWARLRGHALVPPPRGRGGRCVSARRRRPPPGRRPAASAGDPRRPGHRSRHKRVEGGPAHARRTAAGPGSWRLPHGHGHRRARRAGSAPVVGGHRRGRAGGPGRGRRAGGRRGAGHLLCRPGAHSRRGRCRRGARAAGAYLAGPAGRRWRLRAAAAHGLAGPRGPGRRRPGSLAAGLLGRRGAVAHRRGGRDGAGPRGAALGGGAGGCGGPGDRRPPAARVRIAAGIPAAGGGGGPRAARGDAGRGRRERRDGLDAGRRVCGRRATPSTRAAPAAASGSTRTARSGCRGCSRRPRRWPGAGSWAARWRPSGPPWTGCGRPCSAIAGRRTSCSRRPRASRRARRAW